MMHDMLWVINNVYEADRCHRSAGIGPDSNLAKPRTEERRSNLPTAHCPSAKVCRENYNL